MAINIKEYAGQILPAINTKYNFSDFFNTMSTSKNSETVGFFIPQGGVDLNQSGDFCSGVSPVCSKFDNATVTANNSISFNEILPNCVDGVGNVVDTQTLNSIVGLRTSQIAKQMLTKSFTDLKAIASDKTGVSSVTNPLESIVNTLVSQPNYEANTSDIVLFISSQLKQSIANNGLNMYANGNQSTRPFLLYDDIEETIKDYLGVREVYTVPTSVLNDGKTEGASLIHIIGFVKDYALFHEFCNEEGLDNPVGVKRQENDPNRPMGYWQMYAFLKYGVNLAYTNALCFYAGNIQIGQVHAHATHAPGISTKAKAKEAEAPKGDK